MNSYEVSRAIAASPEKIWQILADADALIKAGTGITKVDGKLGANQKIKIWNEVSPRPFSLLVSRFEPGKSMIWRGGMPLGLFTGERTFTLTPEAGVTRFHMREEFSGLLSPLIVKSIPDLQPSFEQFADALKSASEQADG